MRIHRVAEFSLTLGGHLAADLGGPGNPPIFLPQTPAPSKILYSCFGVFPQLGRSSRPAQTAEGSQYCNTSEIGYV